MTAVYWILGIIGYLAIAVAVMRWRTARINAGKAWRILMFVDQPKSPRELTRAHAFTTSYGLFWPFTVVISGLMDLIFVGLFWLWEGIDWTMHKVAGLPRK